MTDPRHTQQYPVPGRGSTLTALQPQPLPEPTPHPAVTVHITAGVLLAAGATCQVHALNPKLAQWLYAAANEAAEQSTNTPTEDK